MSARSSAADGELSHREAQGPDREDRAEQGERPPAAEQEVGAAERDDHEQAEGAGEDERCERVQRERGAEVAAAEREGRAGHAAERAVDPGRGLERAAGTVVGDRGLPRVGTDRADHEAGEDHQAPRGGDRARGQLT